MRDLESLSKRRGASLRLFKSAQTDIDQTPVREERLQFTAQRIWFWSFSLSTKLIKGLLASDSSKHWLYVPIPVRSTHGHRLSASPPGLQEDFIDIRLHCMLRCVSPAMSSGTAALLESNQSLWNHISWIVGKFGTRQHDSFTACSFRVFTHKPQSQRILYPMQIAAILAAFRMLAHRGANPTQGLQSPQRLRRSCLWWCGPTPIQ